MRTVTINFKIVSKFKIITLDPRKCPLANKLSQFKSKNLREDVESYIIPGMEKDPTLPRDEKWMCSSCGNLGALYFQLPERVADDAMTLVFVCLQCRFYEIKGKQTDGEDES